MKLTGYEDRPRFNEPQAEKRILPRLKSDREAWHRWADRVRVWVAALTDNGSGIFHDVDNMRTSDDLVSLELGRLDVEVAKVVPLPARNHDGTRARCPVVHLAEPSVRPHVRH